MIVNRHPQLNNQQQQVGYYHLSLSMFLLFLTIYPYLFNSGNICCSVSAYSANDIDLSHDLISNFDIIQTNDILWTKSISIRSAQQFENGFKEINDDSVISNTNELNAITNDNESLSVDRDNMNSRIPSVRKELHFSSLGRRFELILDKPSHLTTDDFYVVSVDSNGKQTRVPYKKEDTQIMDGYVKGDKDSKATCSFNKNDNLMTAQIKTGHEIIIVEPTYLHEKNLRFSSAIDSTTGSDVHKPVMNSKLINETMIVYNLSDHKEFQFDENHESAFNIDKLCPSVKVDDELFNSKSTTTKPNAGLDEDGEADIFKFYKKPKLNEAANNWRLKRSIDFFDNSQIQQYRKKTRCTLHLVADYLFYKYVGNGDLQTTINYLLALINRVNQIYLPTVWETGNEDGTSQTISNIGFTVQNITIHREFTRLSTDDKHYNMDTTNIWNAREFLDNFSKYSPPRHYCLAHLFTYRQFDSKVLGLAYVASTRYGTIGGICSPTQRRDDGFFKHNTGISTSKGISGETLITRQADLVVAHELGHNMGAEHDSPQCRPQPSEGGAYLMHPFAVMGFEKNNRYLSNCSRASIGRVIKKKGPECFVSVIDHVCGNGIVEDDEECDGGDVGHNHNDPCCDSNCRLTPGSQCSDRHSWCCSRCHIKPAGAHCKPAEEFNCKQSSYCNGRSPECPPAPPVEDDKICVGRGLCRGGDCKPFCEAKDLISCLCNTQANACKLCCKATVNGTCTPYDSKAPYLDDGLLCYKGVCEKGRCEQPIQDAVQRLWDVLEDINFSTFVKFLRDNIIFVVIVVSVPLWCLISHFINEFDKKVRAEVMNAIALQSRRRKNPPHGPFLPRLFVGDELSISSLQHNG